MTTRNQIYMGNVRWCICHGPNASHLHNCEWFARKRDALARMPVVTMFGRAARLTRHEWHERYLTDTECDVKEIAFWHSQG